MDSLHGEESILELFAAAFTNDLDGPAESGGITSCAPSAVETYQTAPNPVISCQDQNIGLPLAKDAEKVVSNASKWRIGNATWEVWAEENILKLVKTKLEVDQCKVSELKEVFAVGNGMTYGSRIFDRSARSGSAFGKALVFLPSLSQYTLSLSVPGTSVASTKKQIQANTSTLAADVAIAAWYHGVSQELTTHTPGAYALVLSYDLLHTGSGSPPQLPDNSSALEEVERALTAWAKLPSQDGAAKTLTWILDRHYPRLKSSSEIAGHDASRIQLLLQVANSLKLRVFAAELTCKRSGLTRENYSPEYSIDESKAEEMSIESREETVESTLRYIFDLTVEERLPKGTDTGRKVNVDYFLPKGAYQNMIADLDKKPRFGSYESWGGVLELIYDCTAIVIIPESEYGKTAANLFSWRAVYLLDSVLWKQNESGRMTFAEQMIQTLPLLEPEEEPKPASQYYTTAEEDLKEENWEQRKECNDCLFKFALENKRLDLLIEAVSKLGTENLDLFNEVAKAFAPASEETREKYNEFVFQSANKQRTTVFQVEVVMALRGRDENEAQRTMESLFQDKALAKEYLDVQETLRMESIVGQNLLQSSIFPKLQNYHETAFWLELLERIDTIASKNEDKTFYRDLLHTYLPEVVSGYICIDWQHAERILSFCLQQQGNLVPDVLTKLIDCNDKLPRSEPEPPVDKLRLAQRFGNRRQLGVKHPEKKPVIIQDPIQTVILRRVRSVAELLEKHDISLSTHTKFFQRYFIRHVLPLLGPRPTQQNVRSTGKKPALLTYEVRPVKCKQTEPCRDCVLLNTFLTNGTQREEKFSIGIKRRDHMIKMMEKIEHPNVSLHNKREYNGTLTVTKKTFDVKAVEGKWETLRKEIAIVVQDLKEGLGPMLMVVEMATNKEGGGWTGELEKAANEVIGDSPLGETDLNVSKRKRKALSRTNSGMAAKRGRKRARAEDVIDLTNAEEA